MNRRVVLKTVAASLISRPINNIRRLLQGSAIAAPDVETLRAIAEIVLPASIGPAGRDRAVKAFVAWVANYKPGADMGHGYGSATLRAASGPSPALRYPPQFAALDRAARAGGASTFAALPLEGRRLLIEAALNGPPAITRLPAQPNGANLIADFMGSYFTSAEAWDLCYQAEIRRDSCRTLDDSAKAPVPIRGR